MINLIFLYDSRVCKCSIQDLKVHGCKVKLIVNQKFISQWTETIIEQFDEVYIVKEMTYDEILSVIESDIFHESPMESKLLSSDEGCIHVLSKVSKKLNIHGYDTSVAERFTDKIKMKDCLKGTNLLLPSYELFDKDAIEKKKYLDAIEKRIPYPMFVKPIDLYGAAGAQKILNRQELEYWQSGIIGNEISYNIESFLDGYLFHVDSIITQGEICHVSMGAYLHPVDLFPKGRMLGTMHLCPMSEHWDQLMIYNRDVILAMNPPDGVTHLEVFVNVNKDIYFLEIGVRPPGGLIIDMYEKSTGLNLEMIHFKANSGLPIGHLINEFREYHAWAYIPKMAGRVKSLVQPDLKSHWEIDWRVTEGEALGQQVTGDQDSVFSSNAIAGVLHYYHPSYNIIERDFQYLRDKALITYG